jgi:hypothetical protein
VPKRLVSFALQSHAQHSLHPAPGYQEGRKLLQSIEAVLSCHGAVRVKVDQTTWVVMAVLPLSNSNTEKLQVSSSMVNDRETGRQGEEVAGGVSAAKGSGGKEEESGSAFTFGLSTGGGRRGRGEKAVHKRQRPGKQSQSVPDPSPASILMASPIAESSSDEGIAIRINIYAQRRDRYDVISSIGKQVDDAGALRFMSLMRKVEEDLVSMLS